MIDVEQRPLRAFEQHRRAAFLRAMHHQPDVLRERQQPLGKTLEHIERDGNIGTLCTPETGELCVRALGVALAVFLVGAVLFARGWLGGGDVKLLTAAVLWAGPAGTPALLMLTGVLGGALALFLLMPFGSQITMAIRALLGQPPVSTERGMATPVPYGVAIAGAALIVILSPHFG